ncbi:hypothetical protein II906_07610 [bacterium]|nr:hypothetical protein [bacterium]
MKINFERSPISFCKMLRANTAVLSSKKPLSVSIYQLDKKEDKGYFDNISNKDSWNGADLIDVVQEHFDTNPDDNKRKFYTMEDYWGNCFGILETLDLPNRVNQVSYLETCPEYAKQNKKRKVKYVGETLLTFATGISKNRGDNFVKIRKPMTRALPFYTSKCFFERPQQKTSKMLVLPKEKFDDLIEQNSSHTKTTMEFFV